MSVKGYLAAIPATARKFQEEKAYRNYIRDSLMYISSNTSTYVIPGVGVVEYGAKMNDWRGEKPSEPPEPEDDRPCREVVDDMWARIRGEKV